MEVGGFRVRLDLSQFFDDIKKFSCVYIDLSHDRQIADVVDRISALFGIERPLLLLDERFYLPESENVNALRDSNIVKVVKSFHLQGKESCSPTDHLAKRAKGAEYLGHEIHSEQGSVKQNKQHISENIGSHRDKEAFHEFRGKKRKHEVFHESNCISSENVLQQDLEPEIHYLKKCKRKKERVKKEVLNGSSIEPLEDETEEKNSDGIHTDNKRKKKKNKVGHINGDITEDNIVSEVSNHNLLESVSDHNEHATSKSKGLKKHKQKRKVDLTSPNAQKIIDSEPLHSTDLKKLKKKISQNDAGTNVAPDASLSLSCKNSDTEFLTYSPQEALKCKNESKLMCQNIDSEVNSGVEINDSVGYTDTDFAHGAVNSTPTVIDGCKSTEMADILLQENTSVMDSSMENPFDNTTNTAIITKPKRKRTRVRRHRKRNGILNDSVVTLPAVIPQHAVLQSSVPPRKHIRFEEQDENLKENTSHKEVPLNNDVGGRNNTTDEICNSKSSTNVNDECTPEPTPGTEVTDCKTKNSFECSASENLISKNNTMSLPNQISLHQQWALNTANMNVDSKESLQKLLILGKQNSVPVVFERKRQCNDSGSASGSSSPVSKLNNNKSTEETCEFQNTTKAVNLADTTCLKTNPNSINPLNYPPLQGKPKKNDIIAFKKLKMTSNYTPEMSGFIIATVLSICEDTFEMSLKIEAGESDLEPPKGKFSLGDSEELEKKDKDSKLCQLNWNELMDVRILFP